MNDQRFMDAVARMPALFDELMDCTRHDMKALSDWAGLPAVYVFFDSTDMPCHTGRTRNLQARIRAHTTNNHNAASFAFKRARKVTGRFATYRSKDSRASLMADHLFKREFDRQRNQIRDMKVRFVRISCDVEQYLFELYAAIRLGTSLDEFRTS